MGIEPPKSSFDHFSTHYEEHLKDPLKEWIGGNSSEYYLQLKARETLEHLKRLSLDPKRLKVLEVGCGTGRVARMLHGEFLELSGVDSSQGMIQRARSSPPPGVSFYASDAGRLPFEDGRFDFLYSMCLFHHVPHRFHPDILREMLRVLKPGGWTFHFEHNALNPLTRLVVKRCPVDEGVRLLYPHRMADLFRRQNLRQIHTRFILFFPKYFRFLRRGEPRLSWLPLGGQFYVCGRKSAP